MVLETVLFIFDSYIYITVFCSFITRIRTRYTNLANEMALFRVYFVRELHPKGRLL